MNVKYGTFFGAGVIAATDRNDDLIASGELVRLYTHPPAPTTPQPARKIGGSYQADGYIVSRFTTTAGAERVVFEFNEPKGMLHIFTPEQIEVKL